MKLTFLIPPILDGKKPAERTAGCTRVVYLAPNIYELTVVALLENNGFEHITYRDFVYDKGTPEDFVSYLQNDDTDIYYIWSVNLSQENDVMAQQMIRNARPDAYVVFMGPGATYFINRYLHSERDVVVRGEPEMTVLELTKCIAAGGDWRNVVGISYLSGGKPKNNVYRPLMKELDVLPFPARHFIAHRNYFNPKLKTSPYTTAVTSRNCPFRCIYCVPSSLTFAREIEYHNEFGKKPPISFRSVESVEAEMRQLKDAGYKAVGFMDDNFIWNEERTRALCSIMKQQGLLWGCQARVDAITEPIAQLLGDSGCMYVDLGVESFNEEILKYIKKGITANQIYTAINLLKKYKVPVKLNILIGSSPLETKETLRHTLREAKALKVDQVMFNIVSPFPGTEFYKLAKENGWIATDDYVPTDVQRESILNFPSLTSKEMERALFYNNISYFFSPHFIFTQMRRFSSVKEFTYALKALKIKLFG